MRRYVLTPEAAADLREIRDYVLEQGSPRAARYVVSAIISACRSVALTPGQGHRRPDLTPRNELRFRSVFSYLIVYRLGKKPVARYCHSPRQARRGRLVKRADVNQVIDVKVERSERFRRALTAAATA